MICLMHEIKWLLSYCLVERYDGIVNLLLHFICQMKYVWSCYTFTFLVVKMGSEGSDT